MHARDVIVQATWEFKHSTDSKALVSSRIRGLFRLCLPAFRHVRSRGFFISGGSMPEQIIVDQAIQRTAERAPEILSGSGIGATLVAWLSHNPQLVTSITGICGALAALGGLAWMIYRDIRKMRREERE